MLENANRQKRKNGQILNDARIRIALFDDHVPMREALAGAIARDDAFDVVATGGTADEAFACAGDLLPDLIVLDVSMPGGGIEATAKLFQSFPSVKCVILSSNDSEHLVTTALSAGAFAFLIKGQPLRSLIDDLKHIATGRSQISPALAAKILSPIGFAAPWGESSGSSMLELIPREEQILRRQAQGLTCDEIGDSIGVSGATVANFLTNILHKLHSQTLSDSLDEARGAAIAGN